MTNPQVDPEVKRLTGMMRQYAEGKEIPMSLPDVALALIEMGPDTPGWEESLRALIHSDGYYHDRKGPFPDISTKFWACYCLARYRLSADLVVPELLNQSAHTVELFIHNPTDPFSGIMNAIMGVRILCLYLNKIDQIPEALDAIFRRAINNTSCHYIEPYIALILAKSGHRAPSIAHALILHKTYQTRWDQDHINTSSDPFYPVFDEYEVFYTPIKISLAAFSFKIKSAAFRVRISVPSGKTIRCRLFFARCIISSRSFIGAYLNLDFL